MPYAGAGTRYLDLLRDHYVAIAGEVTDAGGDPVGGVPVTAWRDGVAVAQDTTDARGRYTLPRAHVGEAPVHVTAVGVEARATPDPARTVLVDLRAR